MRDIFLQVPYNQDNLVALWTRKIYSKRRKRRNVPFRKPGEETCTTLFTKGFCAKPTTRHPCGSARLFRSFQRIKKSCWQLVCLYRTEAEN